MNQDAVNEHEVDPDAIEARMGSHVEGIMSAARKAAAQFQAEVERAATERAAQIETAAARRAHAVRMGAEAEAEQLVTQARAATQQYVTASRRLVDEFARERMTRIADVGDKLAAYAEALMEPLQRSEELARQLRELRAALGEASERIAADAARESPQLPDIASPVAAAGAVAPGGDGESDIAADAGVPVSLEERLARATGRSRKRVTPAEEPAPEEATDAD